MVSFLWNGIVGLLSKVVMVELPYLNSLINFEWVSGLVTQQLFQCASVTFVTMKN
jgi:hypothetical protein